MAPRRKPPAGRGSTKEGQVVTSQEVGSDNLEGTETTNAVSGEYPEEYEDYPPEWKSSYDDCAKKGNTVKACVNWAEAHMSDGTEADGA